MYILGISCWYHDSAAVLIRDGDIIAASEEERFSRKKHDFDFPARAVGYCLEKAGIGAGDIEYAVFYDKPFIKFERILSSILMNVPRSSGVFREAVPLWLREKINFRIKIYKELGIEDERVLFCTHHKAHAASCFYVSPFDKSAILTVDGVGEWATASLGIGEGNTIRILKEMRFPHSVGLLYSAFTAFLGFRVNNGEYKVMGMAPYGRPVHKDKVMKVVKIFDDGSIELDMRYFSFAYSTSRTYNRKFERLFGKPRDPGSLFFTEETGFPAYYGDKPADFAKQAQENQYYADIAASIQDVLEEILIRMCRHLKKITGLSSLCYAGGVALNSKANYRIVKESGFDDIYIQPASTDAGGALGAALWCWHEVLGNRKTQAMEHAYFGKHFSDGDIEAALADVSLGYEKLSDDILFDRAAGFIADGKVVGWYQGPTEWGPRALGNRSIIGDPRDAGMKYLVITSRHHDGFSLWDSRYTDYDMASTPYGKGILKELADECKKQGIKFGTYYSICDWYRPDYPVRHPDHSGAPEEGMDAATRERMDQYIAFMKNQLRELIGEYDPFVIWFDGEWEWPWTHEMGMDMYAYLRGLKDDLLINNRVDKGREGMEDKSRDSR